MILTVAVLLVLAQAAWSQVDESGVFVRELVREMERTGWKYASRKVFDKLEIPYSDLEPRNKRRNICQTCARGKKSVVWP